MQFDNKQVKPHRMKVDNYAMLHKSNVPIETFNTNQMNTTSSKTYYVTILQ